MSALQTLILELRRRRVFRVVGVYVIGSWGLLQVAELAFQSLNIPDGALVWVWIAAFIGFPIALIIGWRYELTANGILRTAPAHAGHAEDLSLRGTDYLILTALAAVTVTAVISLALEISETEPDRASMATSMEMRPNSIAVLPLANLSGDPEQEYFVAGMHEALIASLARISGLKVISRTSTQQYRDSDKPLQEIGAELGVANLIEGSVLRVGGQVRITVQLIDAASDEHLWAESYERNLSDVLRLQSSVAHAIAEQVEVKLTPYEETLLTSSKEVDPEAYEFYLKGRFHWYQFSEADLQLALEYFQQSIDKDPYYALAYVGMSDAVATPAHLGMMPTSIVFPAAKQFVLRALELDENLAEAHDILARINFAWDWDWDAAERGFRRAISINPGYPDAHIVFSQFLGVTKRGDESLREVRAGLELDPLNQWYRMELAKRLAWVGRFDEARQEFIEIIEDHPEWYQAYMNLWRMAFAQGRFEEAIVAARNYYALAGEPEVAEILDVDLTDDGYPDVMRRVAILLETNPTRKHVSNIELAEARIHAGDLDQALTHLEQAYTQHETRLVYTIADLMFQPVRSDERYQAILRNMNYPY